MKPLSESLVPFLIGHRPLCEGLLARSPLPEIQFIEVLDPLSQRFYRLLNAGNALAFGSEDDAGLSMPAWVQLDCATLPSAMIGFAMRRDRLPRGLWAQLLAALGKTWGFEAVKDLTGYRGLVPVSEFCALPTHMFGQVMGFSLFSLIRGQGLGLRAKALGLACYGAREQIGITQYDNRAIRTHAALGPLHIVSSTAPPHSIPERTFVYRLAVPDRERLVQVIEGAEPLAWAPPTAQAIPVDEELPSRIDQLRRDWGGVSIVYPGLGGKEGRRLLLVGPG